MPFIGIKLFERENYHGAESPVSATIAGRRVVDVGKTTNVIVATEQATSGLELVTKRFRCISFPPFRMTHIPRDVKYYIWSINYFPFTQCVFSNSIGKCLQYFYFNLIRGCVETGSPGNMSTCLYIAIFSKFSHHILNKLIILISLYPIIIIRFCPSIDKINSFLQYC
jgi:hypothetical protein